MTHEQKTDTAAQEEVAVMKPREKRVFALENFELKEVRVCEAKRRTEERCVYYWISTSVVSGNLHCYIMLMHCFYLRLTSLVADSRNGYVRPS